MKKLFILFIFSCLIGWQACFAQTDMQAALPVDSNVVTGKLANGIVYYLRHNEEPKDRASFYIIRNAGALLENDDQNGLAHFLEHMSFQGTKNFPGKEIIATLERRGVAFGHNINAYTAHNETVYNLSAVPTTDESTLDTCLLILHDWSYYLSLEDGEIDAERGVIAEEWRTRRTPEFRIQQQYAPVLYKGSKYAERDVIGSLDVIKHFNHQTIRDFYHEWYRTDLEAVAIVGDFDVVRMERKVKELFSKIPAVKNPKPRPFFEVPEHEEMYYCLATDKEMQQSSINVITVHKEIPVAEKNNPAYLKSKLINTFCNQLIHSRIRELTQQANPPFINGNISWGDFVRGYQSFSINVVAKPNEEARALEAILTENERIKRFGFAESELERVKVKMLAVLEFVYQGKDKTDNDSYIDGMKAHFLTREPMIDAGLYYNLMKQLIPGVTAEEIADRIKVWNTDNNRTVLVSGPAEGARHLTREEVVAIVDKVAAADIQPYHDQTADAALISGELPGSEIVATKKIPGFDAEEWTLGNGAKVVFRKAGYEKDNVALMAYSKGGTSVYDLDLLPSAEYCSKFVGSYGLGDFDAITLQKLLNGKLASCGVSIGGMSETVDGSSTPQDFETMMQLLYLRFEKPRFDREAHESLMNRFRSLLPYMVNSPQKIMQDTIQQIRSNHHPRHQPFNAEYLDRISLDRIEQVYRDRIKDASDFIFFIVGNIDAETVKPLVEKYIGSIKSENRKESWRDNHIRGPKGKTVREIELAMETQKSTVVIYFSKDMPYSMYNNICLDILKGVLDLRYTENIREKEGGTYGVSVQGSSVKEPYSSYSMSMSFDCDPEKANHLKSLIYAEADRMQAKPATAEEINKVVSNMQKNLEQAKPHNAYWMSNLYAYYVDGIDLTNPKNFEDILNHISAKDIQQFSRKLFKGADVIDLIFKPKK